MLSIVLYFQVKAWITSYTNLKTLHMNYRPKYVTPYMHILSYHVGFFINKYGNIKQFSCQGKVNHHFII